MREFYDEKQLSKISKAFQIYGEILHAEPCKIGHINETYTATYGQGGIHVRYIHQKINKNVFKRPDEVMGNLLRVTSHIRAKLEEAEARDITRRVLTVVPARDGQPYHVDENGDFWRSFVFIENVSTYEAVETSEQAYEAGRAFGEFQRLLSDIQGDRLHETIPEFHHTRSRFEALKRAIKDDRFNRAKNAKAEIQFALGHESIVDTLLDAQREGAIPERITHNDTKFNNVMLDVDTQRAMCVVDLDTVMPGIALYDFGDMVRTTTSPTVEDELDLSRVEMRMPMFRELARGFLAETGAILTPKEKELIAFSGKLVTYNIGIRFLTDFLSGDTYFRVHRPKHNLDRCRTQFQLINSIERQEEAMNEVVESLAEEVS